MKEAIVDAVSQIQLLQSEANVTEGIAAVNNAKPLGERRIRIWDIVMCMLRLTGLSTKSTVDIGSYVGGSYSPLLWLLSIRIIRCMRILM